MVTLEMQHFRSLLSGGKVKVVLIGNVASKNLESDLKSGLSYSVIAWKENACGCSDKFKKEVGTILTFSFLVEGNAECPRGQDLSSNRCCSFSKHLEARQVIAGLHQKRLGCRLTLRDCLSWHNAGCQVAGCGFRGLLVDKEKVS